MPLAVQGDGVKRIGCFELPGSLIQSKPEACMKLFGAMLIVRAEQMYHMSAIQYVAYCDQFDEIETVGNHLPHYLVNYVQDTETWEFVKSDYKGDIPAIKRVSSFATPVRMG